MDVTVFRPLVSSPHFLTVAGNFWPRHLDTRRFPVEEKLYTTEPGVQVLVQAQNPAAEALGHIVLVHGLDGSGEAGYMRGMAQAGLNAGFAMHRFHLRTCGRTEVECPTLYHAGLTSDLLAVVRDLRQHTGAPVFLVGYSLGANVALKLAGELAEDARPLIAGLCAVSTPIDLAACVRRMGQLDNRVYDRRFVRRMIRRLVQMKRFTPADLRSIRTLYDFDDRVTAPAFGFRGADEYYATQSSSIYLERIRIPTLLIQAKDDTFIPFESFQHPAFAANPNLELLALEHGGHLGFISRRRPRFWADQAVLSWILESR